ncbi:MAG: SPOR domain-containing protein [Oligoflexales bacterium]|nr:SPOR domain-containing protein [Oligoflexales bacterium]
MSNPRFIFAILTFLTLIAAVVFSFEYFSQETLTSKNAPQELQLANEMSSPSEFFYHVIGDIPSFEVPRSRSHSSGKQEFLKQFTLEVDILETQREAELLLDALRKDGVIAYYTPIHIGDKVIYRVRKGVYPSKKLAKAAKASIASKHGIDSKVVELR